MLKLELLRAEAGVAAVPILVAAGLMLLVALAFLCQCTLYWRYRRLHGSAARARAGLSKGSGTVHEAVEGSVGGRKTTAGALFSAIVDSAARRRSAFNAEVAISSVERAENQLFRAALVRWVAGNTLVMGLAGTFVAFIQLIAGSGLLEALSNLSHLSGSGGLSPQLEGSYHELSNAFSRVYQALGYAFLSSLAGLVGSVFLSFFNALFVQRQKARALLAMEQFAEKLYSVVMPPTDQQEELVTALTAASTALQTAGQTIDTLREASGFLESAAQRFEAAEQTNAELGTTLATLTSEIKETRGQWDTLVQALRESKAQTSDTIEAFRKEAAVQRGLTDTAVSTAVSGMREITKVLSAEIRALSAAKLDNFVEIQRELRTLLLESKKDWEAAGAAIIAQTGEAFTSALGSVNSVIAASRGDAAKAHTELSGVAKQATDVVTRHEAVLERHAAAVADVLTKWGEAPANLQQTLGEVTRVVGVLSNSLDRLSQMPAQWEQRVVGSVRQLDAQLREANTRASQETAPQGVMARWRAWLRVLRGHQGK